MCILTDANIMLYYYLTYQQVALVFYPDRYRIGPFEVESALQEHPAVVESAAVAAKDSLRGEVSSEKGGGGEGDLLSLMKGKEWCPMVIYSKGSYLLLLFYILCKK